MSHVSKLNKKNILLKESNNKMLYVSEVIKKSLEIFYFCHLHTGQNHHIR